MAPRRLGRRRSRRRGAVLRCSRQGSPRRCVAAPWALAPVPVARLDVDKGFPLPVIEVQSSQDLGGQPVAPKGNDELATPLLKVGNGQVRFAAEPDHVERARAEALDVMGQVERTCDERIRRFGRVRHAQLARCQPLGQVPRVPHLDAVGKDEDLHGGVRRVITVSHGVDDDLRDGVLGDFLFHRGTGAHRARADCAVELGHHKIHGCVHLVVQRALEDLVGRNGLGDLDAVEAGALDHR